MQKVEHRLPFIVKADLDVAANASVGQAFLNTLAGVVDGDPTDSVSPSNDAGTTQSRFATRWHRAYRASSASPRVTSKENARDGRIGTKLRAA